MLSFCTLKEYNLTGFIPGVCEGNQTRGTKKVLTC